MGSFSEFFFGLCSGVVLFREGPQNVDLLLKLLLLRVGYLSVHHLFRPLRLFGDERDAVRLDLLHDLDVGLRASGKICRKCVNDYVSLI